MNKLAVLLEKRGKLEEAGPRSVGQRGGLLGSAKREAFLVWPGPETGEFSFLRVSPEQFRHVN